MSQDPSAAAAPPPPPPPPSWATPPVPTASQELQFDTAEPAQVPSASGGATAAGSAVGATCASCRAPIDDYYYAAGDKVLCPTCGQQVIASMTGGSGFVRFLRALVFGIGAGIGGCLVWYGVRRLSGYEVGLVAIVVGLMVGGAVRAGARGRGGALYQVLAVVLTYLAISTNYIPDIFEVIWAEAQAEGFTDDAERTVAMVLVMAFSAVASLAAPFLGGLSNIIGLLIIGFALWEAWKINNRQQFALAGPYSLRGGMPPAPPGFPMSPPYPQPQGQVAHMPPPPPPPPMGGV